MRIMVSAAAAVMVLAAAGCATKRQPYKAPDSGPTARLLYRNAMELAGSVSMYDDAARCSRRSISPDVAAGQTWTTTVPAGKDLALTANYYSPATRLACRITISFPVREHHEYLLELRPEPGGCRIQGTELDEDGKAVTPFTTRHRIALTGWDEPSDWCSP